MTKYLILAVAVLLTVTACGPAEPQEVQPKFFAELFIRYLETEREYKAQAVFLTGDSLPVARPKFLPGSVRFVDRGMNKRELGLDSYRYDLVLGGDYAERNKFRFPDEKGQAREFALKMSPVGGFALEHPLKISAGLRLTLKDQPLAADESLLLLFTDDKQQSFSVDIAGPSGSSTYQIPSERLGGLKAGTHELYVVKKQTRKASRRNLEVLSTVEFYSRAISIAIEE